MTPQDPIVGQSTQLPTLTEVIQAHVQWVVKRHNGNLAASARELGVSRATLYNWVKLEQWPFSICGTAQDLRTSVF